MNTIIYVLICIACLAAIIIISLICWQPNKKLKVNRPLLNEYGITNEEIKIMGREALVLQELIEQKLVDKPEVEQLKRSFLDKLYNLDTLKEDVINIKVSRQKQAPAWEDSNRKTVSADAETGDKAADEPAEPTDINEESPGKE